MPRRSRTFVLAVAATVPFVAAIGTDAGSLRADTDTGEWPFGPKASDVSPLRKRDLYNLGILGAKAWDPDREEPKELLTGRQQFGMEGDGRTENDGPDRLRIELLHPDGPARKAGLRVGDVLTGVGGLKFRDGSLAPLAKALVDAESGKSKGGIVRLSVERAGAKEPLTVEVAVPVTGAHAEFPTTGKMRDQLVAAAADWLAKHQGGDGGFPQTLSGPNGSVCQASLAGLLWLAAGSDLKKGPYAKPLRKAVTFVTTSGLEAEAPKPVDGGNTSQVNWGLAHGAIFLGELEARSHDRDTADGLRKFAQALVRNQEASGGWAHGPGGPNGLGYVELNIVSGLALGGIGLAQRAGFEVPAETWRKADAYLAASSGGDGGVGYSTSPGQAGQGNIGRTAGAWLGALTLGQRNAPASLLMESYVREHAGDVFGGHASLMQHYLLAGIAAHAQGGEARQNYWATCERDLVLARAPDGSFQPRPWQESLSAKNNTDVSFGEVWTTVAWALVLACEPVQGGRPGLPAWMGKLPPPLPPKKK